MSRVPGLYVLYTSDGNPKGKEMSHTPGPWHICAGADPKTKSLVFQQAAIDHVDMIPPSLHIGLVACPEYDHNPDYQRRVVHANACLIAAAPELLKALRELEANADTGRHPQSAIDQARAAIAKAEGK